MRAWITHFFLRFLRFRSSASCEKSGPRGISSRKFEVDDSSGMDESSLASLAEDKKLFQKLEKEAEVINHYYYDVTFSIENSVKVKKRVVEVT